MTILCWIWISMMLLMNVSVGYDYHFDVIQLTACCIVHAVLFLSHSITTTRFPFFFLSFSLSFFLSFIFPFLQSFYLFCCWFVAVLLIILLVLLLICCCFVSVTVIFAVDGQIVKHFRNIYISLPEQVLHVQFWACTHRFHVAPQLVTSSERPKT